MNPQEVLEASIIDTPPPFPSIDELITRERRRSRARRAGAATASMVGLIGAVLGVTLVAGQLPGSRTPEDPARPPAAPLRPTLLSTLLTTQLSTVLPEAGVVPAGGSDFDLMADPKLLDGRSYRMVSVNALVAPTPTMRGLTQLSVTVFWPTSPASGTASGPYASCSAVWSGDTPPAGASDCQERSGPNGSTIFYGWYHREVDTALVAVMAFPGGPTVRAEAYGKTDTMVLTAEVLANLVADPRYVIWSGDSATEGAATPDPGYGVAMEHCLSEKGWDVQAAGDGGFTSRVPVDEYEEYELDVAACRVERDYGGFALTPQIANHWYDTMAERADCLRTAGYAISEVPGRDGYVARLAEGQLPTWDPYLDVFATAGGLPGLRDAQAVCPQPTSW